MASSGILGQNGSGQNGIWTNDIRTNWYTENGIDLTVVAVVEEVVAIIVKMYDNHDDNYNSACIIVGNNKTITKSVPVQHKV